jgi:hypothetical protein
MPSQRLPVPLADNSAMARHIGLRLRHTKLLQAIGRGAKDPAVTGPLARHNFAEVLRYSKTNR